MRSLKDLKNPDIITINGEKLQVIENTSVWYHADKDELEMRIGLVKIGTNKLTPTHVLHYIYEKPGDAESWRLLAFDEDTKEMKEVSLDSYEL